MALDPRAHQHPDVSIEVDDVEELYARAVPSTPSSERPSGRVNLSAQAAADLYELLRERGIRCWVMGGWGVDALVGGQTRDHHDLDVLLLGEDLPALGAVFRDDGFEIRQVWEAENRWLDMDGSTWPTAFVAGTEAGVELDVHVIELRAGVVVPLRIVAWPFDAGSLDGRTPSQVGRLTACQRRLRWRCIVATNYGKPINATSPCRDNSDECGSPLIG